MKGHKCSVGNMRENLGCILSIYLEWLTVDWIKQLKENNNK
jgi:hypothetical protein